MISASLNRPETGHRFGSRDYKPSAADWNKFIGTNIPSSLELDPVFLLLIPRNTRILDLGCGFGKSVFELYRQGYRDLHGLDFNATGVDAANHTARQLKLDPAPVFTQGDARRIPMPDKTVGAVLTQAFWTTLPEPDRRVVMKEINRVLEPGGKLYIADFDQAWENPVYRRRYELGIAKGYDRGTFEVLDDSDNVEYLAHHFTRGELSTLLKQGGFDDILSSQNKPMTTRSGNVIPGHVLVAGKTRDLG
jgi:ubiquinone/menaquinone biosynthesis C-methylase UbiE